MKPYKHRITERDIIEKETIRLLKIVRRTKEEKQRVQELMNLWHATNNK